MATSYKPLVGQANAALARYDGLLQGIPNPAVMLSPLTTQEAVLSSKIEGTQATVDEVLEQEAGLIKDGEKWLLVTLSGFNHGTHRTSDQVDHADEGLIIAVPSSSGSGGLEQTIHAFQPGVGVGGGPALNNALPMIFQSSDRLSDRLKPGCFTDQRPGVVDEVGDAPLSGSRSLGLSYPGQLLLDPPGGGGIKPLLEHLGNGDGLVVGQVAGGATLEHGPAQVVGQRFFAPFELAYLVDRAGEGLHDMKPVDRHRGVGQLFGDPAEKGRGHVADHFDDVLRVATMVFQKGAERLQGSLALAGHGKENGFLAARHVDEDGDVVMSPLGGCLI